MDSISSALRIKDYINKLYCDVHLNSLINRYMSNKLIYNIHQYVKSFDKKDIGLNNIFMDYIY